jgi:lauroyl/myristoyl acyltransferase
LVTALGQHLSHTAATVANVMAALSTGVFILRFWLLWLGLGLLWLVTQLPYRALLTIGRLLGAGMYRVAGERRRIAARNLELCFPEKSAKERKQLLKENFASTGIAFFEMAMSWWWSRQRLARLAHVEGLEHLKQAQLDGKGVILMALHFTTLEIGAALLVAGTVAATSKFAKLGKALVVPFTQQRLADGSGYRLVIHPPLTDFPGESDEVDCLRINQWVEASVRECPEQYLWTHRRFKSRPPGEPKLYEKRRR